MEEIVDPLAHDVDPQETREWKDALEEVIERDGPERAHFLIEALVDKARRTGAYLPYNATTAYMNTIPPHHEARRPGDPSLERRLKSIIRWNAMAMVVKANRKPGGLGGHIATYQSVANLFEVGFNHFFHAPTEDHGGDLVMFQGHSSPGVYARAFLEGRLGEEELSTFREETVGGLSSYPHPWLMPGFWQFPTVSMGLTSISAIYQARFMKYLDNRGLIDAGARKVWAFLGDGEMDEPESLGAISLGSREKLDNLVFVINCNLQRLDGPVRGNGKIIQELEGAFRGAGWNVIKVIWGDDWDPLLEKDSQGFLAKRMMEVVDGQYQRYSVSDGPYIREHFFGKYPELLELVKNYSDDKLNKMRRGGHDPEKVYAAYHAATECKGRPTVIIAKTIKGYGVGEGGEGRNVSHNQKKLNEDELREFRTRFGIPVSDELVADAPFYRPPEDSPEMVYLREHREALGGSMPCRTSSPVTMEVPTIADYEKSMTKLVSKGPGKEMSTTMGFVRLLGDLLRDKKIGKQIVPIVPDESRTFGMEGLFRQVGIYAHAGQHYEPVDSDQIAYYKEAQDGQLLEEGITEAGAMSSFVAAGTSYSSHGVNMIPMFIYYSMFGFQRIGDLIWAAADVRAKGFMLGGTAGRTTLNGEGLQHQDGHSLINAMAFPTVRAYDPAYSYETAVIVFEGLQRMYVDNETAIYYITLENENYLMPEMPAGCEEGIIRGMYQVANVAAKGPKVQLFGSGPILRETLRASQILADKYDVASDVWSITSYNELRRDAQECQRWNMLNPGQTPRRSYVEQQMEGIEGPVIAATDYLRILAEQLNPWIPGGLYSLGTDGMGRSESREALRRHFEVDAECIALAALSQLAERGKYDAKKLPEVIKQLEIDPEKKSALYA